MVTPQPQSGSYFAGNSAPIKVASQESSKSAIRDNNPNNADEGMRQQKTSFSQAVRDAKIAAGSLSANKIYNMNEADAIKYTKSSIADLEQKMAKIASLSSFGGLQTQQTSPQQPISSNNTQVQNSVSNVTNITSDYLRNIRGEYQKMPQWRSDTG